MDNIDTVCSSLQPLLKNVLCAKIGICAREIELVQLSTGMPTMNNIAINDHFKLKIPISDQYATWEVAFNCSCPDSPPDFDLNDIDFLTNTTIDSMEELVPSLDTWDCRNPQALINVISELRSAYLKYQVEQLASIDNHCAHDYSALMSGSNLRPGQVEVFIDNNLVNIGIKLELDFTSIIQAPTEADAEEPVVMLVVRYSAVGTRSTTLCCSDSVQQFCTNHLDLPYMRSDYSLLEYAEEVMRSTEKQISSIVQKRKDKRKMFLIELLKHLGHSIIDCDLMGYYTATYLLEQNNFVCILKVTLSNMFPNEPPKYRLSSIYSTSHNLPIAQVLKNVPWNECWDVPVMVNQALNCIKDKIQIFKNGTVPCFKPIK